MAAHRLLQAAKFAVLLLLALAVGAAVTVGAAIVSHWLLVALLGESNIAANDDTLLMRAVVLIDYAAGIVAAASILRVGWRRYVRRARRA